MHYSLKICRVSQVSFILSFLKTCTYCNHRQVNRIVFLLMNCSVYIRAYWVGMFDRLLCHNNWNKNSSNLVKRLCHCFHLAPSAPERCRDCKTLKHKRLQHWLTAVTEQCSLNYTNKEPPHTHKLIVPSVHLYRHRLTSWPSLNCLHALIATIAADQIGQTVSGWDWAFICRSLLRAQFIFWWPQRVPVKVNLFLLHRKPYFLPATEASA